jgi:HlyD family secretion protein
VLAKIDDATYAARVNEVRARVRLAEAQMAVAEATLKQATTNLQRARQLAKTGAVTPTETDASATAEQTAKSGVSVAAAEIAVQKASLTEAELALDRTTIRSPISGVVIDRRVNVGQAVSSKAELPSLFLIAADLKKLEIWASVAESNIARVKVGQPVQFTVDAVPGKTFDGRVRQIRLNAQMTQNFVAYTVVISLDNADEKLLPYMTANVRFSPEKPASE